ncbi:MAG: BREX system serine/threonine kinase PglW, partial [Acidimicrobiales bacterium]
MAFLRRRLPDREPYQVWSNFEFVAPSGALYEVDALAVTDNGVHLIEIKSHPGAIGGDGSTWQWTTPQGKVRLFDNPRLLANRKAKALKEVLGRTKEFARRRNELPYVAEAVFLSDADVVVTLSPPGRYQVFRRDPDESPGDRGGASTIEPPSRRPTLPGIVEALTSLDPDRGGRPRRRVDRPLGARLARAVERAGIRERTSRRRIGDYRIVELIDDVEADRDTGVAYQDFVVEHVNVAGVRRRLRLYPLEQNATTTQREVAARAAKREFEYLFPLDHPGILAPRDYIEHERGPCLLFDAVPGAQRLDRWVARGGLDRCGLADRIDVVRALAEALAHAHQRGVFHRALCPSAVLVSGAEPDAAAPAVDGLRDGRSADDGGNGAGPDGSSRPAPVSPDASRPSPGPPQVRITNWHAGARVGTGESTGAVTGTQHVEALSGGDAPLYRAPEFLQPLADPALLDVFSLGCLACFVFTGAPPAASPGKLDEMLLATGYVAAEVAGEPVDDWLALFVANLTDKDPASRPASMADVLALLDQVEAELTAPDPAADEPHIGLARRSSIVGGGRFEVLGRIGMGSTAFALLVRDARNGGRVSVLKVARTPDHNGRLEAEGAAIAGLHHPSIVHLYDGPLDLDGHAALLLSYAGRKVDAGRPRDESDEPDGRGDRTLTARIGEPLGAELAERFGEDLLDAVRHLEQMGVAHRDIKPENLGIAPRGDKDELHLVLFDFSLAAAPIDRVDAGTPGYLDPFLRRPDRGRWDPAAERYAAAVVLYEICTGTKPVYGDGTADPVLTGAPLTVDAALFEPSVADGLARFFDRALAPDTADRYGTADDMLWAWREAFRSASQPAAATDHGDEPGAFSAPAGTTRTTPLAGLPLSNRAVNALERHEILTVGDLLDAPVNRLSHMRGVGALTRRELLGAVAQLREAMAERGEMAEDAPLTVAAAALVPRVARTEGARADLLRRYLGLDGDPARWPSQGELAGAAGVTRARVSQILTSARSRWSKQPPVTALRTWLAGELAALGDVASVAQLVDRLERSREHEPADDDARRRAATALVRAALVVEAERTSPRWVRRVVNDTAVVVARHTDDGVDGNTLADYAVGLAERTRALVADAAVVARTDLVDALRQLDAPDGTRPLPDAHLAELAASLCPAAAVNSRLELYRRGLPAEDALRAARRAFVATDGVTPDDLAAKVRARFPDAEPLPPRPRLDALLDRAALDLRYDAATGEYRPPTPPAADSTGESLPRHATAVPTRVVTPVEIDEAADFEDRLARAVDGGGLLVLVTDTRNLDRATDELARLPVTVVDMDDWLIGEIERLTAGGRPSWELVVEADAAG